MLQIVIVTVACNSGTIAHGSVLMYVGANIERIHKWLEGPGKLFFRSIIPLFIMFWGPGTASAS